jgi:epoxide hydrolase 4
MNSFNTIDKEVTHGFANSNGIKIHYITLGESSKPLVILLHGFPEFWYSWRNQIRELAKHFNVVAADMRGYNDSDKPKGVRNYAMDLLTGDVKELIRHVGYERATIIAHDWGGSVAWRLALDYPSVVEKLIVLNSPYPSIFAHHLKTNPRQMLKSWYMFFYQIPAIPEMLLGRTLYSALKKNMQGWSYNKNAFTDDDIQRYVDAIKKPGALNATLNYYRARFRYKNQLFRKDEGRQIQSPTLVIWGKNDRALGVEMTNGMEKHFANSFEIKFIDRCSHWVQHEYPELVNEYILDFLKSD